MHNHLDKSIFLTFDIDWACDDVLYDTINLLNDENVKATFFVTHCSEGIDKLKEYDNFELGIHPNFVNQEANDKNISNIIENLIEIVPNATSVRTHSLVQSSIILDRFKEYGLKYDVNLLIPYYSKMLLKPFRHWSGIMRLPYFWEDDVHCIDIQNKVEFDWNPEKYIKTQELKIFDFHPIHVYLNTEDLNRYKKAKKYYHNEKELRSFINLGKGTRTFLKDLIKYAKNNNMSFKHINEVEL